MAIPSAIDQLGTRHTRIFEDYLRFAKVLLEPTDEEQAAGKTTQTCVSSDAVAITAALLALAVHVRDLDTTLSTALPEAGRGI